MKRYGWLTLALAALLWGGCSKAAKEAAEVLDPAVYGVGKAAKKCPVSKEEIGSMGPGVEAALSNGKKMMFCCPACKKTVEKDLAKYAAFQY